MTNTEKLKTVINESGFKIGFISENLGITREAFYRKMKNETEFKASEIVALKRILKLSDAQRNEIFLNDKLN